MNFVKKFGSEAYPGDILKLILMQKFMIVAKEGHDLKNFFQNHSKEVLAIFHLIIPTLLGS